MEEYNDFASGLGKSIKMQRVYKEISQAGLAKALGVKQSSVSRWESGKVIPDCYHIKKISDALGTPISVLFKGVSGMSNF